MANRKKATADSEPRAAEPCLADWRWWGLDGPCSAPASWRDYCKAHSERGPGWTREWATSPFDGSRFRYIVREGPPPPPALADGEYARPEYGPIRR